MLIQSGNCPYCKTFLSLTPASIFSDDTSCPHCENKLKVGGLLNPVFVDKDAKIEKVCPTCNTHMLIPVIAEHHDITTCPRCQNKFSISELHNIPVTNTNKTAKAGGISFGTLVLIILGCIFLAILSSDSGDTKSTNSYDYDFDYNDTYEESTWNIAPTPKPTPKPTPPPTFYIPPSVNTGCCKVCTTGKACGDSCISRSYTCHKPPGCACDG